MNSNILIVVTFLFGLGVIGTRHTKGSFFFIIFLTATAISSGLWALSEKESVVKACTIAAKKAS